MGKTNAWGIIGLLLLLLFVASLGMAGDKEYYEQDGEWKVENRLFDLRSNNQITAGGIVFPQVELDVLEVRKQELDWDSIRKARFEAAANAALQKILFDFDKDTLDAEASAAVEELTALLKANQDMGLKLSGHTDLMGSAEYNLDLSFRRAENVRRALLARGIDGSRLQASFHGKATPLINIVRKERQNRRVQAQAFDLLTKP